MRTYFVMEGYKEISYDIPSLEEDELYAIEVSTVGTSTTITLGGSVQYGNTATLEQGFHTIQLVARDVSTYSGLMISSEGYVDVQNIHIYESERINPLADTLFKEE